MAFELTGGQPWLVKALAAAASASDREYAVARGRIDLLVRWPLPKGEERFALEFEVWQDDRLDPRLEGLE